MCRFLIAAVVCAAGVVCLQAQSSKPGDVSPHPFGKAIPSIGLPPGELTPSAIVHARGMAAEDTIDWSVSITNAPTAWAKGLTGKGVKVAVLDTGVDANHRDLKAGIVASKDFTGSPFGVDDRVGHGTHCAGSIGARKNGWGIVGQAYECDLIVAKVLGDQGSGAVDGIAKGIDWAVEQGADVISMSLGGGGRDEWMEPACDRARAKGVLVIAAAGNDNGGPVSYPGAYPACFAISAIDKNKALAGFSNVGAEIRATGPGVNVRSCYPGAGDGLFADLSGTSMATPNVAGVAALWCQADKGDKRTRPARFDAWLKETCGDLGAKGRDERFGYGLPDAGKVGDGPVQPPVPGPAPGGEVKIGWADLTEDAKARLTKAGITDWSTTIRVAAPGVKAATLTLAQVAALAEAGPVTVYHKVDPTGPGFILLDGPIDLSPGVYTATKEQTLNFKPK